MSYDYHSKPAFGKAFHDVQNFADHFGIQRRSRLVEQENFGFHCERAGDCHPLLLPARKLRRTSVDERAHTYFFEIFKRDFFGFFFIAFKYFYLTYRAVFEYVHIFEQIERLKNHSDLGTDKIDVYRRVSQILPPVINLSRGGFFK